MIALIVVIVGCGAYWLRTVLSEALLEAFNGPHDTREDRARCEHIRAVLEAGFVRVGSTKAELMRALGQPDATMPPEDYPGAPPNGPVVSFVYVTNWCAMLTHGAYWIGIDAKDVVVSILHGEILTSDVHR